MGAYYYLVAGLPDISIDDNKLSFTVQRFKEELYPHFTTSDKKVIDLFYLKFDNANLLALLKDKEAETDARGLFGSEELLCLIDAAQTKKATRVKAPDYLIQFLSAYFALEPEDRYKAPDMLAGYYYAHVMNGKNKFCNTWFEFEFHVNNILAALTARKYGMSVSTNVVGDTPVCKMLKTEHTKDFGLAEEVEYFDTLQKIMEIENLTEREKRLDILKWNTLDDMSFFYYFGIEKMWVFLLKLDMVERWLALDKESGYEMFRNLIQGLKDEVKIPEEFRK